MHSESSAWPYRGPGSRPVSLDDTLSRLALNRHRVYVTIIDRETAEVTPERMVHLYLMTAIYTGVTGRQHLSSQTKSTTMPAKY